VFGSLKNYLSGKSGEKAPGPSSRELDNSFGMTATVSSLASTVSISRENVGSSTENHPGKVTDLCAEKKVYIFMASRVTHPENCQVQFWAFFM
jgi:hypothetical protein